MSNNQLFLQQIFRNSWPSNALMIGLNALGGFIVYNWEIHIVFKLSLIVLLLYKSFLTHISNSIMPGGVHDYSWKYLQSLPLTKKQIAFSLSCGEFFSTFVLVSWFVAFYPEIYDVFADEHPTFNIFFKQLSWLLLADFALCLGGVKSQIEYPRKLFSSQDPKAKYYHYLKSLLITIMVGMYLVVLVRHWAEVSESKFDDKIKIIFEFIGDTLKSWWMPPIILCLVINKYFNVLKIWQDEKISYSKTTWDHKTQLPQVAVIFSLIVFGYFHFDYRTPFLYSQDKFLTTVHHGDVSEVESKFSQINTNYKSKYNVSPLYVAARNGDFKMYKYLIDKGFVPDLSEIKKANDSANNTNIIYAAIKGKNDKIFSDLIKRNLNLHAKTNLINTYLQYAARQCQTKMIDMLIEKKVNINEADKNGNTALHHAADFHCFGAVVALVDAGANPLIKNKEAKVALDLMGKWKDKTDLSFYLEKKTRAPASIKK